MAAHFEIIGTTNRRIIGSESFIKDDMQVLVSWKCCLKIFKNKKKLFPPGLEPGTFRVLGERDNHYTTETLEAEHEFNYMKALGFCHYLKVARVLWS